MTHHTSGDVCPSYHIEGCETIYIDFLTAPKEVVQSYAATPVKKRKGPRGGVSNPFPNKLREMLSHTNDIISWNDHGRCFGIVDPDVFVREVLPRYVQ